MKKKWIFFLLAPPVMILFIGLVGYIVQQLWNWLLPPLFGWGELTFWRALGMLCLCRILFGGFGGGGNSSQSKRRWDKMSPEERDKFRQAMRSRVACSGPPAGDAGQPA